MKLETGPQNEGSFIFLSGKRTTLTLCQRGIWFMEGGRVRRSKCHRVVLHVDSNILVKTIKTTSVHLKIVIDIVKFLTPNNAQITVTWYAEENQP